MIIAPLSIEHFSCLRAVERFARPSESKPLAEKVCRVAIAILATIPALIADLALFATMKISNYTSPLEENENLQQSNGSALYKPSFEAPLPSAPPSAPGRPPLEHPEIRFARDVEFLRKSLEEAICPMGSQATPILMRLLDTPRIGQPEIKLAARIALLACLRSCLTDNIPEFIDLDTSIEGVSLREFFANTSSFAEFEWSCLNNALYNSEISGNLPANVDALYNELDKYAEALSCRADFVNAVQALKIVGYSINNNR